MPVYITTTLPLLPCCRNLVRDRSRTEPDRSWHSQEYWMASNPWYINWNNISPYANNTWLFVPVQDIRRVDELHSPQDLVDEVLHVLVRKNLLRSDDTIYIPRWFRWRIFNTFQGREVNYLGHSPWDWWRCKCHRSRGNLADPSWCRRCRWYSRACSTERNNKNVKHWHDSIFLTSGVRNDITLTYTNGCHWSRLLI